MKHLYDFLSIRSAMIGGLSLLLVGCNTTEIEREQASQREDIQQLESRLNTLGKDIQSVQSENEALKLEISDLKSQLTSAQDSNERYQNDIKRLDELVKKLDTAREKDRKLIVDEVTREISRLSKSFASAISESAGVSKSRESEKVEVEEGVEHVVSKGETLTAIAAAYGVSKKAIIKANQLKNTDLKIGQKLFIPKK